MKIIGNCEPSTAFARISTATLRRARVRAAGPFRGPVRGGDLAGDVVRGHVSAARFALAIRVRSGIPLLSRYKPRQSRDRKGAGGTPRSKVDGKGFVAGFAVGPDGRAAREALAASRRAVAGCCFWLELPRRDRSPSALARQTAHRHHGRPLANAGSAAHSPRRSDANRRLGATARRSGHGSWGKRDHRHHRRHPSLRQRNQRPGRRGGRRAWHRTTCNSCDRHGAPKRATNGCSSIPRRMPRRISPRRCGSFSPRDGCASRGSRASGARSFSAACSTRRRTLSRCPTGVSWCIAPPFTIDHEAAVLGTLGVDWLVARNSGGSGSRAKIDRGAAAGHSLSR